MEFTSSLGLLDLDTTVVLEKKMKLLSAIKKVGSISKAAKEVPLSYKAAWEALNSINNLCPYPVVIKVTGGKGGGGAALTTYGENLLNTYTLVYEEHQKFLTRLSKLTDFNTGTLNSIKKISMQLSARNQLGGVVEHIDVGLVNISVYVRLKSGYSLVGVITKGAFNALSLQIGDEVVVIFKANSVLLTSELTLGISARNKLQGRVVDIEKGEVNSQILLDIGGDVITAVITTEAVCSMGVKKDDKMSAIVKSSEVIIGK